MNFFIKIDSVVFHDFRFFKIYFQEYFDDYKLYCSDFEDLNFKLFHKKYTTILLGLKYVA